VTLKRNVDVCFSHIGNRIHIQYSYFLPTWGYILFNPRDSRGPTGECSTLLRQWVRFFIHLLILIKTYIRCQLLNWT